VSIKGIFYGCGDFRIVMYFYRWSLLLHPREGCGLLEWFGDFPSATNNIRQVQGGATTAVGYRHDLEVEDEGCLKNLL
jgi:hypothetical protein